MDHDGFVLFGGTVKGLLDNMTAKSIHAEVKGVAANGPRDCNDLVWITMFKAALDEKVAEAVDHERIGLIKDGLDDFVLLLIGSDFQLLLQEDGGLLIIVADDFIDNVLPVAAHGAFQQTTVVGRLGIDHVALLRPFTDLWMGSMVPWSRNTVVAEGRAVELGRGRG